jgi:hypothetical protein
VDKAYDREGWVITRTRGEGPLTMSIVWKAWRNWAGHAGVRLVRSTTCGTRPRP